MRHDDTTPFARKFLNELADSLVEELGDIADNLIDELLSEGPPFTEPLRLRDLQEMPPDRARQLLAEFLADPVTQKATLPVAEQYAQWFAAQARQLAGGVYG